MFHTPGISIIYPRLESSGGGRRPDSRLRTGDRRQDWLPDCRPPRRRGFRRFSQIFDGPSIRSSGYDG